MFVVIDNSKYGFCRIERLVTRFTLPTHVKTVRDAKKDIVIRDTLSDATSLTYTTDANLEIFVLTFMKKPEKEC